MRVVNSLSKSEQLTVSGLELGLYYGFTLAQCRKEKGTTFASLLSLVEVDVDIAVSDRIPEEPHHVVEALWPRVVPLSHAALQEGRPSLGEPDFCLFWVV